MARNRKRKRSGQSTGQSKQAVGNTQPGQNNQKSDDQKSQGANNSAQNSTNQDKPNQNNSNSQSNKNNRNRNNSNKNKSQSRGNSQPRNKSQSRNNSKRSSSNSKGRDNSRGRGRFDLPQDEFDKIYRARVESSLDPALAISTAKNFEPDRGPIPQKKHGILFADTVADALKIAEEKADLVKEVETLHISVLLEGSREVLS